MFGRPLSLGTKHISAEIRWAVRHGYLAGKNGHKSWLSGLYVVCSRCSLTSGSTAGVLDVVDEQGVTGSSGSSIIRGSGVGVDEEIEIE
jgi:hypothetical protein